MEEINLTKDYELKLFDLQKEVEKIDITLKSLFDIVYDAELKHEGIAEIFGMPNFVRFYEEISRSYCPDNDEEKLNALELYWGVYYEVGKVKGKLEEIVTKANLAPRMDFHAVGEHWKTNPYDCQSECKEHNSYGIEFRPLYEIAHLPIKINPIIEYEKMTIKLEPSLYQVINSIFWELTFHGYTPKERIDKGNEITEICKESKEDMKLVSEGDELIKRILKDEK